MIRPRKRFGQNFLRDKSIVQKIVTVVAAEKNDRLVEIGPGYGALTAELLKKVKLLAAIEVDRDLVSYLQQNYPQLKLYQEDALKFDFSSLGKNLRIVANLPYNISTPILFHLLHHISHIKDMHLMLQKEVAERITAEPGSKIYGRLSVMLQYYCCAELLFPVKATSFYPVPKVESAVIRLKPYKKIAQPAKDPEIFAKIVKQAFSQRRKVIRNSLRGLVNIDSNLRPEELSVADFVCISNMVSHGDICNR